MTSIHAIIQRSIPPVPWTEGDNIPWNDPSFSERMLAEHLTQDHDLASRTIETIEAQVSWIHRSVLEGKPSRVLDLACGPGLYLNRLAAMGHGGLGIDFSPASIRHARQEAAKENHDVEFLEADLRTAGFGSGFDVVLLLYGQINVFRRDEADRIVRQAVAALNPGGSLIIEPQIFEHVSAIGTSEATWSSHDSGLFSAEPHLLLTEAFWDEARRCTTQRFHVIDARDGCCTSHAMTTEAHTDGELRLMLEKAGCHAIRVEGGFQGPSNAESLVAYVGRVP